MPPSIAAPKRTQGPRDIPALPQDKKTIQPAVRQPLDAMRTAVQTLMGFTGDPLDKALTRRELRDIGLAGGFGGGGGSGLGGVGPAGPPGPSGAVTPDFTPPPSVTGLAASAGLSNIIVTWDAPVYTQGHGHRSTNLYVVKRAADDPSLPTFAEAVLYEEETGALTISALPSDLSIRWHIWAKYETNDGVESASPAGGINGVSAQTGKIGNNDLGPLIVTADKISAGAYAGMNLVPNGGAEDGLAAWTVYEAAAGGGSFTVDTTDKAGGAQSFKLTKGAGAPGLGVMSRAFPVIPGETYSVKVRIKTDAPGTVILRIVEKNTGLSADGFIVTRTSFTDLAGTSGTTSWATHEFSYTVPGGIYYAAFAAYLWVGGTATTLNFDDVSVGRQITASALAAGSIAAGSAAIADAAITRAMLGLAIIDDARIANVSAAKLTVGDGTIGGNLKSANYIANVAGWLLRPDGAAEFGFAHIRGLLLASQVAANFVTATMIQAGAVTAIKINVTDLSAISANMGTITAGSVHGGFFHGGGFTNAYSWPVSGQTGFHLSSSGLLLGNANDGKFFQVNANGDVYAPGLSIVGGAATFGGALSGASGSFDGTLSAAALTIAGAQLTIPRSASASGDVSAPVSGRTTLLTLSSIDVGTTGQVTVLVTLDAIFFASGGGEGGGDSVSAPTFSILRNGSVIGSFSPPAGLNMPSRMGVAHSLLDQPGTAAVYTLTIDGGFPGGVAHRTLTAIGSRR